MDNSCPLIRRMLLGLRVAAASVPITAWAAPVTFDFTEPPSETGAAPTMRTFTEGNLTLTVTAFGRDEPSDPVETERVSYVEGYGLGVRGLELPPHWDSNAIDGRGEVEELVFTFNRDVVFSQITFSDHNNQSFADAEFLLLNTGAFGEFLTPGKRIAFFKPGNGNWLLLPAYVFPDSKAGPKSVIKVLVYQPDAAIYVSSLTVEANVPETGTATLLLLGLAAIVAAKRQKARHAKNDGPSGLA